MMVQLDFSGSICEKYKNKDNRIILIHDGLYNEVRHLEK